MAFKDIIFDILSKLTEMTLNTCLTPAGHKMSTKTPIAPDVGGLKLSEWLNIKIIPLTVTTFHCGGGDT